VAQPTHSAHILGIEIVVVIVRVSCMRQMVVSVLHAVDHRAGAEEQQRFEEGVRHQVEHRCRVCAHPDRGYHEPKLADRAVG